VFDLSREVLDDLARSKNWWERRTAVLATLYFIRRNDLDDSFRLAGALVDDEHELVQKAVGGVLREAGKRDRQRLIAFLDKHAATMPRVALRYAIERLDSEQRAHYLALRKAEQHE
jgi:3-methyladenine DNA glycosylase AlkD